MMRRFSSLNTWSSSIKGQTWQIPDIITPTHTEYLLTNISSILQQPLQRQKILPFGYHLIYNNPRSTEKELDQDGYDGYQSPSLTTGKLLRRMWTSCNITQYHDVQYGMQLDCIENIQRVRKINDNIFVSINRNLVHNNQLMINETRSLMYSNQLHRPIDGTLFGKNSLKEEKVQFTKTSVFRYSGISFNSHKIHYDLDYAKSEGFANIVVQGPFLVNFSTTWFQLNFPDVEFKEIASKNYKPIYVEQDVTILATTHKSGYEVIITDSEGHICSSCVIK